MTLMTINDELVESARRVPIHRLVNNPNLSRKVKIKCPFHSEDTPSCVLFPTGGYKCFGCGAHGNTLDFVMNLGCTFEEAINELRKFI